MTTMTLAPKVDASGPGGRRFLGPSGEPEGDAAQALHVFLRRNHRGDIESLDQALHQHQVRAAHELFVGAGHLMKRAIPEADHTVVNEGLEALISELAL